MENQSDKPRQVRPPKKVTRQRLHNQALGYLDRFPASREKMRDVLIKKCKKPAEFHEQNWEEVQELIDSEIERLTKVGILNDKLYAQSKARTMARRGKSVKMIKARLNEYKLDDDDITGAVADLGDSEQTADLQAAVNYVKRRRFGPYRQGASRSERREKDLAALARAGFGYAIALQVIDAASVEALHSMIENDLDS